MWEIIAANQRKSLVLIVAMGALLLGLGWLGGELALGPGGGLTGCCIAGLLWILLTTFSYFKGDAVLLRSSGAHEITPEIHPELFNVVEEMKIASGLKTMPRIYIMDDPGLNAFAAGTRQEKSVLAVTAGLLTRLDRDELQGVVAHETAHILNRDVLYMTLAGVMLGSMQIISQIVMRGTLRGGRSSGRRYRSGSSSSGGGQGILVVALIVLAIVGPILAQIFYFSLSRRREYLADATGARLTRYPEGLASALEKISGRSTLAAVNSITAPMCIELPAERAAAGLLSTHPPIEKRIAILRSMTSAGYSSYSAAARTVLNGDGVLPASAMKESEIAAAGGSGQTGTVRPSAAVSRPVGLGRFTPRETGDLMRAVNQFIFLTSACGLKLKLPPEYAHSTVQCPKCGETLAVPGKGSAGTPAMPASEMKPQIFAATAGAQASAAPGWRTIACVQCGRPITLSPAFNAPYAICKSCGAKNTAG